MIGQGLTLTIVGMVIVFIFLGILVVLMKSMSRIIQGIHARREAEAARIPAPEAGENEAAEDLSEVAAAVAVYAYRTGTLPSAGGAGKEHIAAALAAIAAAGGPMPRGSSREVAAAIASITSHKKNR